jgi:hypothetical protein
MQLSLILPRRGKIGGAPHVCVLITGMQDAKACGTPGPVVKSLVSWLFVVAASRRHGIAAVESFANQALTPWSEALAALGEQSHR